MKSVLIIDDAPEIRQLGALALKAAGCAVWAAASGDEGIALVVAEKPDVVLLDVQMPQKDGPSTLVDLKADARTMAVPVVFLTATVTPEDEQRWRALGAVGVIQKPFRPKKLAADLRAILERP